MKKNKEYEISTDILAMQKVASKPKSYRKPLSGVHFTKDDAVATDGHMMILRKKGKAELLPSSGTWTFGKTRKGTRLNPVSGCFTEFSKTLAVDINGDSGGNPKIGDEPFPSWSHIFGGKISEKKNRKIISINAKYLKEIADSLLFGRQGDATVTLSIPDNDEEAILVKTSRLGNYPNEDEKLGILMPARLVGKKVEVEKEFNDLISSFKKTAK